MAGLCLLLESFFTEPLGTCFGCDLVQRFHHLAHGFAQRRKQHVPLVHNLSEQAEADGKPGRVTRSAFQSLAQRAAGGKDVGMGGGEEGEGLQTSFAWRWIQCVHGDPVVMRHNNDFSISRAALWITSTMRLRCSAVRFPARRLSAMRKFWMARMICGSRSVGRAALPTAAMRPRISSTALRFCSSSFLPSS